MTLLFYGLLGGLLSLLGGVLLLMWPKAVINRIITPLIAFAAGAFLAVSFLDLIPESVEMVDEPHAVFIAVLVGFLFFFILERFLMKYFHKDHDHTSIHKDHTETLAPLVILGDSFHNFLDGVVIALSYVADPALGLITTLAVAAHEIPQEIGDFSILLDQGWSKMKIIAVNIGSSLLTLLGIALGYVAGNRLETMLPYLLAGVGGIFIYISASDLIPEIHHRAGHKHIYRLIFPFTLGLVVIGYVVLAMH
jgi:zinc and cadmium transporter